MNDLTADDIDDLAAEHGIYRGDCWTLSNRSLIAFARAILAATVPSTEPVAEPAQAQKASPAVSGAEPAPTETNMHQVVPGLSVTIADREFRDCTHIAINGVMVPVVRIIGLALAEADSPQSPRARFEQWVTSPPYAMLAERWPNDAENYAWPDCYCDRAVSLAWEAWQARSNPAASGAEPSVWVNAEALALLRERPDGETIGASLTRTAFRSTPLYERPSGAELPALTDASRLDWLIDNCPYFPRSNGHQLAENSRACIDAAILAASSRKEPPK